MQWAMNMPPRAEERRGETTQGQETNDSIAEDRDVELDNEPGTTS